MIYQKLEKKWKKNSENKKCIDYCKIIVHHIKKWFNNESWFIINNYESMISFKCCSQHMDDPNDSWRDHVLSTIFDWGFHKVAMIWMVC